MDDFKDENFKGLFRLTQNARNSLKQGSFIAKEYNFKEYDIIHLFYILITNKSNIVYDVLNKLGIDLEQTSSRILSEFLKNQSQNKENKNKEINFSPLLKEVLNDSFVIAQDLGHVYVGTEHILFAMFKNEKIDFIQNIKSLGVDYNMIRNAILSTVNYPAFLNNMMPRQGSSPFGTLGNFDQLESSQNYFYRNMNELAQDGEYSNITGRDKEIGRLIQILSRKRKNNPILVGDAGVGKTAIVEGFVNKIVSKNVPSSFLRKKVINLDITSIISGARLRGDIEERITNVINEVIDDGNSIVFIDEIHMIVGAGSTGGKDSLDIANILKPYLTGSELSIIGATTVDEYSRYFESEAALARRFQSIMVDELSIESSKQVIYGVIPEFERYHGITIQKEAVDEAVELSYKFIRDRYLPDKALDIIDEAAASLKIGRETAMGPELNELGTKLIKVQDKKEIALAKNDYDSASRYKIEEEKLIKEIENTISGKRKVKKRFLKTLTPEIIQNIIVDATKIPLAAAKVTDKKLKDLESILNKKVIGQQKAVKNVALAVQKSHLGLSGSNRPLASFLFLGPTGVGKTELAKSLASELFGSSDLMLQVNMSELMEMHSVSKLIGSPPGYVGFQEGGQLTNFVKRKPYSVILFDEIEKAHIDTLNILLQILEEGEVTDGKGQKISMRNTIVIMTSNIGASDVTNDNRLGFDITVPDSETFDQAYEDMKEKINENLRQTLKPELLNRIDTIEIFRGLNKEDCLKISEKLVSELILRFINLGVVLDVSKDVVNKINDEGYSKEYGARNIKRKVQELLENNFAKFMLESNITNKKGELLRFNVALNKEKEIQFSKA